MMSTANWVEACSVHDLDEEESMVVPGLDGVALHRAGDGHFYATSDSCTHEKWSLGDEGDVEGDEVTCTLHNARFDLKTGKALCFPAMVDLQSYETKVEHDKVYVSTVARSGGED